MREGPLASGSASAPDVSVIVAVRNSVRTVGACVTSLLAVSYPADRFEIVVVDNGSTDGTREALRTFGTSIRVLTEPTRGAAAARNRGIRSARGWLMAFTDADAVVEREWLSALVAPFRDSRVAMVGGRIASRVGANRIERFGERIHDHRHAIEVEDPPYVITCNAALRRHVIESVGLFDETLLRGQDVDLAWRVHRTGYRLVYAPNAVVRHHNERTILGLMHEGYVHGLHGVRVTDKHTSAWPRVRRRWTKSFSRLSGRLRTVALDPNQMDNLLWLVFDTGKVAGELVGLMRPARVPAAGAASPGRSAADVGQR
jgi:GT2 family glycosyltransferase